MKLVKALSVAALCAFSVTTHAATLAAQSLQCGGVVSVESKGGANSLSIRKVGASSCSTLEVDSQDIRGILNEERTSLPLKNLLGNQLVVIVNSEVVILTIAGSNSEGSQLTEIEKQRLAVEQQRAAREQARINGEAAAAAVVVGAELGSATVDAVNSTER